MVECTFSGSQRRRTELCVVVLPSFLFFDFEVVVVFYFKNVGEIHRVDLLLLLSFSPL